MSNKSILDRVVHSKKSKYSRYIGRNPAFKPVNPLGNPYPISATEGRKQVIRKFAGDFQDRLLNDPEFAQAIEDSRNDILGCFCSPQECHGHVIALYHAYGIKPVLQIAAGASVMSVIYSMSGEVTGKPHALSLF